MSNAAISTKDDDAVKIEKLALQSRKLLKERKIGPAIESYKRFLDENHSPRYEAQPRKQFGSDFVIVREVEGVVASVKNGNPLAEKALALIHDLVFYSDYRYFYTAEEVKDLLRLQTLLDRSIAKTGRDPHDLKTRKDLAEQAFATGQYRTATVEYQRCLGMKDDPAIREKLQDCYRHLHPPAKDIAETFALLSDLKKIHVATLGAKNRRVAETIRSLGKAYIAAGDFVKAEDCRKEFLARMRADGPNFYSGCATDQAKTEAYSELFELYLIEGNFTAAKDLYTQASKDFGHQFPEVQTMHDYGDICFKAGWIKEAEKLLL